MRTPAGKTGQSGFTLLELLMTMAILVLIVGIMGSALQLGVRSWEKGEAHVEEFRRTRIVMGILAQQLKSFNPYMAKEEDEYFIAFEGTADGVKFVTPQSLRHYLITGLKWVHYYAEDGEEGKTLMVKESTVTGKDFLEEDEEEPKGEVEPIALLPGLVSLTFEYFIVKHDKEGAVEEESWVESWSWRDIEEDDEFTTLEAIRITFEEEPEGAEAYGETVTTAMTIPLVAAPTQQMSAAAVARSGVGVAPGARMHPDGIPRRPHDAPF
jgi:general secretion pathway protein J